MHSTISSSLTFSIIQGVILWQHGVFRLNARDSGAHAPLLPLPLPPRLPRLLLLYKNCGTKKIKKPSSYHTPTIVPISLLQDILPFFFPRGLKKPTVSSKFAMCERRLRKVLLATCYELSIPNLQVGVGCIKSSNIIHVSTIDGQSDQ